MNPYVAEIKKDLVSRFIVNGYETYMGFYFKLSCELREAPHREKYNLNKLRHELNNKQ